MTREEAIKLLALIKVAYPTAFKDMDNDTKHATVAMWQSTFPYVPYAIMEMAFDRFRRVSKFPPTVAEMFEELKGLHHTATQDAFFATDDQTRKRCLYVMAHTERFRGGADIGQVNYNTINDNLLTSGERNLIEGG